MKKFIILTSIAGVIALNSCETKKNSDATSSSADTAATANVAPDTSQTHTFKIDTANSIIKWTGKKVTGKHNGTIKIKSGEVTTKGESITGGTIVIDMHSISNEDLTDKEMNKKLLGHLRSEEFFSVEKFPTATFTVKRIDAGSKEDETIVTGGFELKGKTNEISVPVKLDVDDDKIKAKGTTIIDRTKWDIKYGSGKFFENLGDKAIYDEVDLEFDLEGTK